MGSIVDEAVSRMSNIIKEKKAEISLPGSWPVAVGYSPWVEEVWVNYINNALKYGGSPPEIKLGAEIQDNGYIRFWIKDNGIGLSRENCDKLFNQFSRLHLIKAEGHGLGLSIVKRIVEKFGGEVGVESSIGKGSTFWFTLPSKF
jgi:signal transduction histidine kinase